jgi:membrane protease YdiL (CAAX protease family)
MFFVINYQEYIRNSVSKLHIKQGITRGMTTMAGKENPLKQIITFLGIVSVISTGIYLWMFNSSAENPLPVLLMMFTPGISAWLTSLLFRESLGEYGWQFGKIRFLAYAYFLPILIGLIAYGLVWLSGFAEFTAELYGYLRYARWLGLKEPVSFGVSTLLRLTMGVLFTSLFTFGEEVGWSGFLTPKLLKLTSVYTTSIIVGVYFAIWHFPALIAGIYGYGAPLWVALPGFTLVAIALSLLRTGLRLGSGSLWTGVILHASHNMFTMGSFYTLTVHQGYANYLVSETGVFLGIIYIIVATIFAKGFLGYWKGDT